MPASTVHAVARELLRAGHTDNEPDALRFAIRLIAAADHLEPRPGAYEEHCDDSDVRLALVV